MASDYWLAYETSEERASSFNSLFFLSIYSIIVAISIVLVIFRSYFIMFFGLKTTQAFFTQILHSILHAPMSFFDTTPSGRILSRASNDQTNVDISVPLFMNLALSMYMSLLSIIIITCQYAWPTLFFLIPLGWLNMQYRNYYLAASRELTRLDSITQAPVIHHFSESILGFMTIRCFRKQEIFIQENRMLVCPLSYGLSLNSVLFWAIYMSCFVENRMVSVERIKQFAEIRSEAAWTLKDYLPPPTWPAHGNVELENLQARYRPNTPLVLKGITLSIRGGEKVGVVGRTGSGKSTLIQVFFRLIEPSGGRIVIDDIDILKVGLHDLRSRFGIIPQEPVSFRRDYKKQY
ncbi:ABC transporter C family member 4 [Bienertia sinuspersici]